jgi:uncharacterized protein (TIGR02147 family)
VQSVALRQFHTQIGTLALKALDEVSREERNFTGMTVGISQACYEAVCMEIAALQRKVADMVQVDQAADRTYQLNIQFFPLSNQLTHGGAV